MVKESRVKRSRLIRTITFILMMAVALAGCTTGKKKKAKDPIRKKPKKVVKVQPTPQPTPLPPDPCLKLAKLDSLPPVFLPGTNIVITRIAKPCVTRQGDNGYEKDSPWMAMGFPCTAGGGKIDLMGPSYIRPKMASLIFSTDCAMQPGIPAEVEKMGQQLLGLGEGAKLLAYNPFVVQFWEIPGFRDADTGFTVDLRTVAALEGAWGKLREKEPLRVHLYGRENAWVQGDHIYFVEADVILTGNRSFQIQVAGARNLTDTELEEVRGRCESLRPRRNCNRIF